MSFAPIIDALQIPSDALVGQRVPKKLLLEQGAPTAADKRRSQDGIEELHWVAALKPTNIGVPAYRDDVREYLEVAVLTVQLRDAAKPVRLFELVHRAIPYPLFLAAAHVGSVGVSLAHKRWSQGQAGKVVIEDLRHANLAPAPADQDMAFLSSLSITALPTHDLFALYDGLLARLSALQSARITGAFRQPQSADFGIATRNSLDRHAKLIRELAILRPTAHKEKQLNRRVELNLEIKRLEAELSDTEKGL